MAIVGEAEVLIVANTKAFEAQLAALGDVGGAGLAAKSGAAGEDAGLALAGGLSVGAKSIGKDVTEDLDKQTSRMKGLLEDVGNKARNTLSSFGVPASLLSGYKVGALAVAAIGAVSIKLASDMQTADASIATSEGVTTKAATAVGNAFLATAGKSEYSGIKQAQAFALVAGQLKATEGQALSTADAQEFMASSTDLATASGEDLATTTSTLAGAMQAFQIPVKGVANAANVLFNASSNTGASLEEVATRVEQVKGRLGDLSPSLASLSSLLVDLTNNGITSRGAMTALQGSYTALAGAATGSSKANLLAKQTLADYGIQVVNAKGQLTPMSEIIQKLAPQFATMTQQQQLATATAIFGASAAKQMTAVIDAGTQSYDRATDAINKHNAVTDAAALKQKTLSGETETLKAALSDEATDLGSVLVPALTKLLGVVLPVITGFVDLVTWFEKGSTPARLIAVAIAATLTPAIVKMGAEATAAAAKAVAGFVTMSSSASTSATSIEGSETRAGTAVEGLGTTVESTAGVIEDANVAAGESFTALLGPIGIAAAAVLLFHNQLNSALTAAANATGLTQAGNFISTKVLGQSSIQSQYDQGLKTVKNQKQLDDLNKGFEALQQVSGQSLTIQSTLKDSLDKNTQALESVGDIKKYVGTAAPSKDTYINPTGSSSTLSALTSKFTEALSLPANEAITSLKALGVPAGKAAQVLKDAALPFADAIKTLEKEGFSAADAVQLAESATRKNTSAAKTAASTAESDAKKAATAAAKAQSTFTSEVLKALPSKDAAKQLEALGVPAKKATQVLHDAVEPFTDAVKALEKAGLDASNAVKIADAGQKIVEAQAKAAAAAATKAADATSNSVTGVTVNGIQVSGAVYDAAVGSAYQRQTGTSLASTGPTSTTNPGGVTIQSIVINPAPGNDAASLLATQGMLEDMLRQITNEVANAPSGLGRVYG